MRWNPLRYLGSAWLVSLLLLCSQADAALRFEWSDEFSPAEREKLVRWVEETQAGVEQLVGPFPFDVHVTFHRRDNAREPVPWANTQRGRIQGVHFHVDPAYSAAALRADWTASHELSHLAFPYLGSRHAWFAEGFASYMQYQVMQAMGELSPEEVARRYQGKLALAERRYRYPGRPFAVAAPRLRAEGNYPTMYWGGAAYFLQVDAALRKATARGFVDVLRDYVNCCRHRDDDLGALLRELDRLSGATLFSTRYREFETRKGFPDYRGSALPQ